jgi:hypothetical protein
MPLKQLGAFVRAEINLAAKKGVWSDWLTERSCFVVRDLTPVIQSLLQDDIPFLLTTRVPEVTLDTKAKLEAKLHFSHLLPKYIETAHDSNSLDSLLREYQQYGSLALANRTIHSPNRPYLNIDFNDIVTTSLLPSELYSLFVEVPGGIVWEITSEFLNTTLATNATIHNIPTRPCDQVSDQHTIFFVFIF